MASHNASTVTFHLAGPETRSECQPDAALRSRKACSQLLRFATDFMARWIMPRRGGKVVVVIGIATIVALALIFLVPGLVNPDRYRSQAISYLEAQTGKT